MFGDRNAAGGGDQRRERRDIARPMSVAAGANYVDCPGRRRDPQHPCPQSGGRAGDFGDRFAARSQRHQEPAELGRGDASCENKFERGLRFDLGQTRPGRDLGDQRLERIHFRPLKPQTREMAEPETLVSRSLWFHCAARSRKFSKIRKPCSEAMLSG